MSSKIEIEVNNEKIEVKFNTSMRLKDFSLLNAAVIRPDEAETVFAIAHKTYRRDAFSQFNVENLTSMKESIVANKAGGFDKKVVFTGKVKAKAKDAHLMDAYIDKQNRKHAKIVEAASVWLATMQTKRQDAGQDAVINQTAQQV